MIAQTENMSSIPETLDVVFLGTPEWYKDARCRNSPTPDDWFPEEWDKDTITQAIRVCRGCPVREICLASALRDPDDKWGIRGGWTPRRRHYWRRLRRLRSGASRRASSC